MNSPYCCLMETGTQTNEQPLPGSAPRLLINPVAETLMALIFQSPLARRLTALPQREERASAGAAALGRRGASARVTPGLLSSLARRLENLFSPRRAHLCGKEQSGAGVMRVSAAELKGFCGET